MHEYPHEWVMLGNLGHGEHGSIETHQYSVTSHRRSVHGGTDEKEGHKERLHARGGIPGVFFSYVSCHLLSLSTSYTLFTYSENLRRLILRIGYLPNESHQPRNTH